MTDTTPTQDAAMRSITIEIPVVVAHRINETFEGTLEDATRAGLQLINGMGATAYNNLQELATQLNTSTAKVMRTALRLLIEDTARLKVTPGVVGRPQINQSRDAQLYERIKAGYTHAEVAAEYSLSIVRVGQIVAKQRIAAGDTPRRGRSHNARKSHGEPNLLRMYKDLDSGMAPAVAAQAYELDEQRVRDLYAAYSAHLANKIKVTAFDRMQAAHQASLTPEARQANTAQAQLQAAELAAQASQARARALEAQAKAAEAKVLSLEVSETTPPTQPKKLAVIPPSMRNPEMFQTPKEIKPIDFDNLDNRIFDEDLPL